MSTVLHMPAFPPAPYGLKEKSAESFAPAFTSVNSRASISPPDEQKLVAAATAAAAAAPPPQPQALTRPTSTWSPISRLQEDGYRSSSNSASPTLSSGVTSPESHNNNSSNNNNNNNNNNNKRRRSDLDHNTHSRRSLDHSTTPIAHPLDRQPPTHDRTPSMENAHHRSLPPPDHSDTERSWASEHRDLPHGHYQETHRDSQPNDAQHNGLPPLHLHGSGDAMSDSNGHDDHDSEVTRAGVHVELKKRKRQFANRTKTGCGTCRRRKKKCDEAKPECNNCTRGGFICEGYANKIPWPKSGGVKPPPPLQAKERMSMEISSVYARCQVCNIVHIPHCEPPPPPTSRQAPYPEKPQLPAGADGARSRPINVEEHERKPSAPSNWSSSWGEHPPPPRPAYQPEPQPPAQYAQPLPSHEKTPSHEQQTASHPRQDHTPQRQHTARVYHHTPQSMSQVVTNLPPAPAYSVPNSSTTSASSEPPPRHQLAQIPRQPPSLPPVAPVTAAPPAPAPSHYQPPSIMHKSEKEKMLAGDPFLPYDRQLADERQHCTGAVYRFNSTSSASVSIASDERARSFKTIVAARWIPPRTNERHVVSHLGGNVHVTTPFHCDYGYNLSIAENVVVGPNCQLLDSARICIGRNTKIGARVTISTLKTPTDSKALKGSNGTELAQQVWIGENVYIGDGCIIEAGVRIGDHAIVRAGSVVVRDLPPNCIAHGNPAFG